MEEFNDFKWQGEFHNILFVVTSEPAYEMNRMYLVETANYSREFLLINGYHCSCYGFDDSTWGATQYTKEELEAVVKGWKDDYYGCYGQMRPLLMKYFEWSENE